MSASSRRRYRAKFLAARARVPLPRALLGMAVHQLYHSRNVAAIVLSRTSAAGRRSGFVACQLRSWRANGCIQADVLPEPTAPKIATPV